jgi:hypothetical protein
MATDVQYRYKPGTRYPSTVQHTTLYQFIGTLECTLSECTSQESTLERCDNFSDATPTALELWSARRGAGYESLAVEVSKKNISAGCPPYILYGE